MDDAKPLPAFKIGDAGDYIEADFNESGELVITRVHTPTLTRVQLALPVGALTALYTEAIDRGIVHLVDAGMLVMSKIDEMTAEPGADEIDEPEEPEEQGVTYTDVSNEERDIEEYLASIFKQAAKELYDAHPSNPSTPHTIHIREVPVDPELAKLLGALSFGS